MRTHGPEPGHDAVARAVPGGQQAHDVGMDRRVVQDAAVADPLPVPGLRTRAPARLGPTGMVPAEPPRLFGEERIPGRAERHRTGPFAEVGGLPPTVHRGPLRLAGRRRDDRRRARAVAGCGPGLPNRDLVGERPIALLHAEDDPLVARGRQEQPEARRRGAIRDAVGRHADEVTGRHHPVDVACDRVRLVAGSDG